MLTDLLLISTVLLALSSGVALIYVKRLKEVYFEYRKAKEFLGDIVLSFKGDLQRLEERIQSITQRIEEATLRDEKIGDLEGLSGRVAQVEEELKELLRIKDEFSARIENLDKRVNRLSDQQRMNSQRIIKLESLKESLRAQDVKVEAAIPIRGESVLAHLTETELRVLEILAKEGEKTASEIKDRIGLTREHTSRLMRRLYVRGYVERSTDRIPYRYRIKEEMLKILKKRSIEE